MPISRKDQQVGRLLKITRKILMSLNTVFLVVSLGFVGVGILLKLGKTVLKNSYDFLLEKLVFSSKEFGVGKLDFTKLDLASVFGPVAAFLIIVGITAAFLCGFGILTAKLRMLSLSLPYSILLGVMILLQAVLITIVAKKRSLIDGLIKPQLASGITNGYKGYNETDSTSLAWNIVMVTFSCCGVDGPGDFNSAKLWNRKIYQDGWWFTLTTPILCCKMESAQPDDFSCAVNPTALISNYENGCYGAVVSSVDDYRVYIIIGVTMAMLLQIVLFISSVIFTKSVKTKLASKDKNLNESYNTANDNGCSGTINGQSMNQILQNNGIQARDQYYRHSSYNGALVNLFRGLKSNNCSAFGMSALLNAMQSIPGMSVQPYQSQRYDSINYDNYFNMPGQNQHRLAQNEPQLASLGIRNQSGPVILQIPAISNNPAIDSSGSSGGFDEPLIEEVREGKLKRQNTAPVLTNTKRSPKQHQNQNIQLSRTYSISGDNKELQAVKMPAITIPPAIYECCEPSVSSDRRRSGTM